MNGSVSASWKALGSFIAAISFAVTNPAVAPAPAGPAGPATSPSFPPPESSNEAVWNISSPRREATASAAAVLGVVSPSTSLPLAPLPADREERVAGDAMVEALEGAWLAAEEPTATGAASPPTSADAGRNIFLVRIGPVDGRKGSSAVDDDDGPRPIPSSSLKQLLLLRIGPLLRPPVTKASASAVRVSNTLNLR